MKSSGSVLIPLLVALTTLCTATATLATTNPALAGKKLLYVGASTESAKLADEPAKLYLASLGFKVTFADQAEDGSRADDQDIVVISSTISSRIVAAKYRDTSAAVVIWETFVADDMGVTGLRQGIDYGEEKKNSPILLVNAPHPMQGGLPNGMVAAHKGKTASLHWGRPAGGATVIATVAGEPEKATILGFERGAMMGGGIAAPGRRVILFVNTDTFGELSLEGLKLVNCAFTWAAGAP